MYVETQSYWISQQIPGVFADTWRIKLILILILKVYEGKNSYLL